MIYLDLINDKKELLKKNENKYNKFFKKAIVFLRNRTCYIPIIKTEFGELIKIQNFKDKTYNRLNKILNINSIKTVCISNKLNNNSRMYDILNKNNIRIINGNELKKYLLLETVEYICDKKLENLHEQEISFLVKKNNSVINCIIKEISRKVKNINIITNNFKQFELLDKSLLENYGIILNITDNYKKSLIKSDFIINIDFQNEDINKYNIPKYCCFLNFQNEKIVINKKGFDGINVSDLKYFVKEKYMTKKLENFDKEIFYESIIIRNSNPENILNKIKKDKVKVIEIYGNNGKISKKEFEKLKRKIIL